MYKRQGVYYSMAKLTLIIILRNIAHNIISHNDENRTVIFVFSSSSEHFQQSSRICTQKHDEIFDLAFLSNFRWPCCDVRTCIQFFFRIHSSHFVGHYTWGKIGRLFLNKPSLKTFSSSTISDNDRRISK